MLLLAFKITTLLIPICALGVGFYSLYLNPKSRVIWLWFLTNFAVGIWGFGLFMIVAAKSYDQALFFDYFLHFGSALIPILFLHFVLLLLKHQKNLAWLIPGYIISIFFSISAWVPGWVVSGASAYVGFTYWVDAGFLYWPFVIFFYICVATAAFLLLRGYSISDGLIKKQIFYILIAIIIGFIGGGTSFLPQLFNIYPFGNFITFLYPLMVTYGIFLKKD